MDGGSAQSGGCVSGPEGPLPFSPFDFEGGYVTLNTRQTLFAPRLPAPSTARTCSAKAPAAGGVKVYVQVVLVPPGLASVAFT